MFEYNLNLYILWRLLQGKEWSHAQRSHDIHVRQLREQAKAEEKLRKRLGKDSQHNEALIALTKYDLNSTPERYLKSSRDLKSSREEKWIGYVDVSIDLPDFLSRKSPKFITPEEIAKMIPGASCFSLSPDKHVYDDERKLTIISFKNWDNGVSEIFCPYSREELAHKLYELKDQRFDIYNYFMSVKGSVVSHHQKPLKDHNLLNDKP